MDVKQFVLGDRYQVRKELCELEVDLSTFDDKQFVFGNKVQVHKWLCELKLKSIHKLYWGKEVKFAYQLFMITNLCLVIGFMLTTYFDKQELRE